MARIRTIKPEFFDDPDVAAVSLAARLFFIGLWTQADKEGRVVDDIRRLKARIFPYDDLDCETLVVELHRQDMIRRYPAGKRNGEPGKSESAVEKHGYIWIRTFRKHQRPHPKEPASVITPHANEAGKRNGEDVGKNGAPGGLWTMDYGSLDPGVLDLEAGQDAPVKTPSDVGDVARIHEPAPLDQWLRQLQAAYPRQAVTSGHLTESAFVEVFQRGDESPPLLWARMLSNLENQRAGAQWSKGMIPKLQTWLREGAWQQRHEPAAQGGTNPKTAGNLAALRSFAAKGRPA